MRAPSNPETGIFQRIASRVLDAVYPPICAVCNMALKDGRSLCHSCDDDLPRLTDPFCQCCGEMFQGLIDGPFSCPNCSDLKFSFAFARPAMLRDERTLDLIHRLKYSREIHLARELGRLAAEAFIDPRLAPALEGSWPLVPVPLHRKRLRNRHFNQAGEISHSLSGAIGLPIVDALKRVRETDTQTLLSRKQRMENLRGAFEVTRQGQRWIENQKDGVVLVDDVLTTGSTVNECAKTLKRAGVKSVFFVTVMRG
jgi:competence protein ComFC